MSLIIIDWVSASWKSTALKRLQHELTETVPNYSKLFLSEHFTERFFEGKEKTKQSVQDHVRDIIQKVAAFHELHQNTRFHDSPLIFSMYLERLLLTFYSNDLIEDDIMIEMATLLSRLNAKHILLTIPSDLFEQRLISTFSVRNENSA